jgi:hypothetical protein
MDPLKRIQQLEAIVAMLSAENAIMRQEDIENETKQTCCDELPGMPVADGAPVLE